jgi:hypothetical protein
LRIQRKIYENEGEKYHAISSNETINQDSKRTIFWRNSIVVQLGSVHIILIRPTCAIEKGKKNKEYCAAKRPWLMFYSSRSGTKDKNNRIKRLKAMRRQ